DVKVKSGEVTDLGDVKAGSGGSIFGQVVRGSGKEPVEGAEVMVRSVTGSLGCEKTLSTNSEGKFDIIGLKAARYEIKTANRRLSREIRDSNVVDLVIELGAVKVTGMVTLGGKPYRGWVYYRSGDEESLVHTEQGRYTIDGLKPGQYEVEVSLESGI